VTNPYWPVADLRLRAGEVELRPMTEADLGALADLHPPDYETDPRLASFTDDPARRRGTALHQAYWLYLGSWRPESWRLPFTVTVGGRPVGMQDLEAADFGVRRTVQTASWLAVDQRGRGVGKAMRLAVLALGFDGLGAEVAETEAWPHNAASLGVSRALGYVDNGRTRHVHDGHSADLVRMRLTRERWRPGDGVLIEGLDACRHFFDG
jgi:RimJ/RimL family protein N-acetyltransferase